MIASDRKSTSRAVSARNPRHFRDPKLGTAIACGIAELVSVRSEGGAMNLGPFRSRAFSAWAVLILTVTVFDIPLTAELKSSTRIVDQADAPVKILEYTASYFSGDNKYITEGIHHNVTYANSGDREIVAVQFGLVSFDVWNRFLNRTNGLDRDGVKPAEKRPTKSSWVTRPYGDFSFLTGVAFVNRVRFADGTIWEADEKAIVDELRKIESDFDAANLKEKREREGGR
jgi:hypothetical protein